MKTKLDERYFIRTLETLLWLNIDLNPNSVLLNPRSSSIYPNVFNYVNLFKLSIEISGIKYFLYIFSTKMSNGGILIWDSRVPSYK